MDITEQLRNCFGYNCEDGRSCPNHNETLILQAAAEIETLRAKIEGMQGAISWIQEPFVNSETPEQELRSRISFCIADATRALGAPHD